MASGLTQDYDQALADLLVPVGYARAGRGTFVRSNDEGIWYGLQVSFFRKYGRLAAQPALVVYCPAAARIADEGLSHTYETYRKDKSRLKRPLACELLYARVNAECGEDRMPYSYDAGSLDQVVIATQLMYLDFSKAAGDFFATKLSVQDLRDDIVAHPNSTGAGVDAMSLSYVLNSNLSSKDIDRYARICQPNDQGVRHLVERQDR